MKIQNSYLWRATTNFRFYSWFRPRWFVNSLPLKSAKCSCLPAHNSKTIWPHHACTVFSSFINCCTWVDFKLLLLIFESIHGLVSPNLSELLSLHIPVRALRSLNQCLLDYLRTNLKTSGDTVFAEAGPKLWNSLPLEIRKATSVESFKTSLKTHHFALAFSTH